MSAYPWLKLPIERFTALAKQRALAHAQLVGGSIGYGARELCESMAQTALCQSVSVHGACGFCKSCQLFEAKTHPDYYFLEADGNQIKVDQVRNLCQKLHNTSQQGGYRVAVILQSEKLNHAAANALLKTLEEPGDNTLLILQSDTPRRLMATVTSRCQQVHIEYPNKADLISWLDTQIEHSEDKLWCLPVIGGPLPLINACNSEYYSELLQLRKDWSQSLSSGHLCATLLSLNEGQIIDALKILYLVLRQQLLKATTHDPFVRQSIVQLAEEVMIQAHQLSAMPNVNYLAICQGFVLKYKQLTKS